MLSRMTVIFEEPKIFDFLKSVGLQSLEFKQTLSAPLLKNFSISEMDLMPPPTTIGINIFWKFWNKFSKLFVPYK